MESKVLYIKSLNVEEARELISSSSAFRNELSYVSDKLFKLKVEGCSSCYLDAFAKIKLFKMENLEKTIEVKDFELKRGVVLYSSEPKYNGVTIHNCTTDKALHHLSLHPDKIIFFSKFPKNYLELVANYGAIEAVVIEEPIKDAEVEKESIVELESEQEAVKPTYTKRKKNKR
jgi:hypothetical protein